MNKKTVSISERTGKSSKAALALQKTIDENRQLSGDIQKLAIEIAKLRAGLTILEKWNELSVSEKLEKIEKGVKPKYEQELAKIQINVTPETVQENDDDTLEVILNRNKALKKDKELKQKTISDLNTKVKAAESQFHTPIADLVKQLETDLAEQKKATERARNKPAEVRVEYREREREVEWGHDKYSCCEAPVD
ncbi:MAG: hypothetical protein PHV30_04150 [Candidatus Margulisbacteria bacterium]|nr:hypothetical protein [Candidatus Margulisiibacteriota bacterium]